MSGAGIVLVTAIVVAALLCLYVVWRNAETARSG